MATMLFNHHHDRGTPQNHRGYKWFSIQSIKQISKVIMIHISNTVWWGIIIRVPKNARASNRQPELVRTRLMPLGKLELRAECEPDRCLTSTRIVYKAEGCVTVSQMEIDNRRIPIAQCILISHDLVGFIRDKACCAIISVIKAT